MDTDQIEDKSKTHLEEDLGTPVLNADRKKISVTGYRISINTAIHKFLNKIRHQGCCTSA